MYYIVKSHLINFYLQCKYWSAYYFLILSSFLKYIVCLDAGFGNFTDETFTTLTNLCGYRKHTQNRNRTHGIIAKHSSIS